MDRGTDRGARRGAGSMMKGTSAPAQGASKYNAPRNSTTGKRKLYHYTTGEKLALILESGYLKPSAAGGSPGELPLLWLSTAKEIEPTALKLMQGIDGRLYQLTREQQRELAGNVRFVLLAPVELLPWRDACKAARITSGERKRMEHAGAAMGASRKDWYATPQALPIDLFDMEVDTGRGWIPLQEAV